MQRMTVLIALLVWSSFAHAFEGWKLGWYGALSSYEIDDANGPTDSPRDTSLLNFLVVSPAERDQRLFIQAFRTEAHADASAGSALIGQDIERSGASISRQWLFRLSRAWKPWIGLGIGYVNESRTSRHTVAADGFLGQRFDDVKESGFQVLLNASTEWEVADRLEAGFHLQLEQPISDSSRVLSGGITILYRY
jgi:hypothetical protein